MSNKRFRPSDRDAAGRVQWRHEPMREPPERMRGWPRRIWHKEHRGSANASVAQEWARQQPWFRCVVSSCRQKPYSVAALFYWVLDPDKISLLTL